MQEREEKKQNRIAQQEREIMERERGIMGTGNEGTIHIQTHTHTATIDISRIPLRAQ